MIRLLAGLWRTLARWQLLVTNYFHLYPKNFPQGGPPKDLFVVNERGLRREYKLLQLKAHPDKQQNTQNDEQLTMINRSYQTLNNPYTRLCHLIQVYHPEHIDIADDRVVKQMIGRFEKEKAESIGEYKEMLMTVLEEHERLEMALSEADVDELNQENEDRIGEAEEKIEHQLAEWPPALWDELIMEAIRLKYWVNIANACKEWEPGKPVHLTH